MSKTELRHIDPHLDLTCPSLWNHERSEVARRYNAWDEVKSLLESAVSLSISGNDGAAIAAVENALEAMEGEQC